MPGVTVRNDTPDVLNVAFRFVAPANWENNLEPGKTWTTHLASAPYTVEVRLDLQHNQFSAVNSLAVAGDITGGYLVGAAGVALGALSEGKGGIIGKIGLVGAAPLVRHSIDAERRFARNADGMVITVGGVWIPFNNKAYAVRFDESSGYSLWDVSRDVKL